jgi:predicted MPP superfamily phosphohydrolase
MKRTVSLLRSIIPFQHRVELVQISVPVEYRYKLIRGIYFIQISDLHSDVSGITLPVHLLTQLAQKISLLYRRHEISFLVITGDFIHNEVEQSIKRLKRHFFDLLPKDLPIYGSLGNHDLLNGQKDLLVHLLTTECRVILLDNSYVMLNDNQIMLIGVGDYIYNNGSDFHIEYVNKKLSSRNDIPNNAYIIALSHNPVSAECLLEQKSSKHTCELNNRLKFNLVLSGHTHASQVLIPFIGQPILPTIYHVLSLVNEDNVLKSYYQAIGNWKWLQGLIPFGKNNRYLYINRGIGSHFGFRFACRPEITLFHFV